MAKERRKQGIPERASASGDLPAMSSEGPGGVANAAVPVCRPLAALELGFHTRLLWTLQAGVWPVDLRLVQNVDPALDGIRRCLLGLSDRINPVQHAHFSELATRVEDRHDEAAAFKGQLMAELFEELADEDAAMRALPGRIERRAKVLRAWQHQDWEAVRVVAWNAVEGDRRLEGWWEVGFRVADMTLPAAALGAPDARTDENLRRLHAAIGKLPDEERAWVRDALPVVPPADPRFTDILHATYSEYRAVLPGFEMAAPAARPGGKTAEFVPSDNSRVVRWGDREYECNRSQAAMVKALHENLLAGKPGLSAETLFAVARSNRYDKRVEHVFRHYDAERKTWIKHPALVDGLLTKAGGVWRLGVEKPG